MNGYRIALVVDHFPPHLGGIETQVSNLAKQLSIAGHQVTVVTTTPGPDLVQGVKVERLPARLIPHYQVVWSLGPLQALRQSLARHSYDVVHCHSSIYSPLAYGALLWCQQLQLPSVLTVHSLVRNTARLFRGLDWFAGWRRWPTVWSTVSHFNAELMSRHAQLDRVDVLPNGTNVNAWRVERQPHDELRLATLLRLNRKKLPDELIRAIPHVLDRYIGDRAVRFRVIGSGPMRSSLERLARRLKVDEHVEFLGRLTPAGIRKVFETTDVLAHPTRAEAFGIAVLEAMAAGLPVVAMAGCGVSDLITHWREGFLAQDRRDFAEHIALLLNNAALRTQMSEFSLASAQRFDWSHVIPLHLQLYERAIRQVRGGTTVPLAKAA